MPILLQILDALRNYDTQIADLQQRLSTSQSEFNACSANLSIANFQLERLNTIVRATSNQLNGSTRKVIELRTTVLNLSSLRDALLDFINSIRSQLLRSFPLLAAYNFSSVSFSFLSELCKRIFPQCSGPDPRIAQLLAQPAPACDASAHAGSAVRRRAHRSGSLLPAPGSKRMACGYSCGPPRCQPASAGARGAGRRTASGRGWGPSCGRGGRLV